MSFSTNGMDYLTHYITVAGYFGYFVLFVTIFLESFPMTFFLPGDSLLFTTGFLASQGHFNMFLLIGTLFVGSMLGYLVSYFLGEKLRNAVLHSKDSYWFKRKHLEHTQEFYKKYGAKTIIIGRFVPVVRSFSATLAGAVEMNYSKFIQYAFVGGVLWTVGVTSVGYYLGKTIPGAHLYLTPIILGIVFCSLLPTFYEYYVSRKEKAKLNNPNL